MCKICIIFSLSYNKVYMFCHDWEQCENCKVDHHGFEFGLGERTETKWDFTIKYKEMEDIS